MHERKALPPGLSGDAGGLLLWSVERPGPFDPFGAEDAKAFRRAIGGALARRPPKVSAARSAADLSRAALTFMSDRRLPPRPTHAQDLDWHTRVADAAGALVSLLDTDLCDRFPPDIGHLDEVRALMGVWWDARVALAPEWPSDARLEAGARVKDAGRAARHLICSAPDSRLFLRILHAAASAEAVRLRGYVEARQKPGTKPDVARHAYVGAVMQAYRDLTGRQAAARGWNDAEERRASPAARFLAAINRTFADRLLPEERDLDPGLEALLRRAQDETGAAQWIDQAQKHWAKSGEAGSL